MLKSITLGALLTIAMTANVCGAASQPTYEKAVKALKTEAAASEKYQKWDDIKRELAAEITNMKMLDDWMSFQNKKYQRYIKRQQKTIAELKRRKAEAQKIRMELEPFLETIVDKLEEQVNADLPFLNKERTQRIAFLRDSLDDYHLELSEKLRRIFEALQVETEYGRNVETASEQIELSGIPTTVSVFRLGRTALYYQTEDGKSSGYWDRHGKTWVPVNTEFSRDIQKAKDMASRKRAVELISLPITQPADKI
ncbi:DUF3450 domain-containing protein [Desulfovibrio sp. JC010]|uniref:DUF3450 domain-containing protein n=1 Tax=Desulfovibrio sp. JC010 TaxID=2593641 RepID=UPI0013D6516E|nr:DUF3450 domain-containing protein [Desulfovibrio sp. JC010]NDV26021.1 DUF3450 domain-containing protein [Desulfovibrio sp. JC010]